MERRALPRLRLSHGKDFPESNVLKVEVRAEPRCHLVRTRVRQQPPHQKTQTSLKPGKECLGTHGLRPLHYRTSGQSRPEWPVVVTFRTGQARENRRGVRASC